MFDEAFLAFASNAGYVAQLDEGVPVLASDDGSGEVRYHVVAVDSGWTVTRSDRAGDPVVVAVTSEAELVSRYLAIVIGESMRPLDDFLLLWHVDPDVEAPAEGFRLQTVGGQEWFVVVDAHGDAVPLQLRFGDAISFSFAAHATLPELYASFLDVEGRPALHDAWLRWRARRSA